LAGAVTVGIGAKVPNSGPLPTEIGIARMAAELEHAGFESLWVSDHVVLPAAIESRYPFAADGRATWATSTPYFDAIVALALIAAATERATFGTAVLVLPLRNPVILAKQAASLDVVSGGRLALGVGAGWLEEEFDALGVSFAERGKRFVSSLATLREAWTGSIGDDILSVPTPVHPVPLLVGGHSRVALGRAGRLGDGWLGQQSLNELDPGEIAAARATMAAAAREAGRDPEALRVVLRIVDAGGRSDELAARLPELERAGVDDVIVDLDWDRGNLGSDFDRLAGAAA
jgi:probable F420-dependent oxidoreductase